MAETQKLTDDQRRIRQLEQKVARMENEFRQFITAFMHVSSAANKIKTQQKEQNNGK